MEQFIAEVPNLFEANVLVWNFSNLRMLLYDNDKRTVNREEKCMEYIRRFRVACLAMISLVGYSVCNDVFVHGALLRRDVPGEEYAWGKVAPWMEGPLGVIIGLCVCGLLVLLTCVLLWMASPEIRTAEWNTGRIDHIRKCMTRQGVEVPRPLYRTMPAGEGALRKMRIVVWCMVGVCALITVAFLFKVVAEGMVLYPESGLRAFWDAYKHYNVYHRNTALGWKLINSVIVFADIWYIMKTIPDMETYIWQQKDELNRLTTLCHEAGISIDE
jgi:hypothetical protein